MKVSARHTMLFPTFPVSFLWTLCSVNVFVLTAYSDLLLEDDPFQPVTSDETVAVGGTVTLTCQVAENDNSSLQWSNTAQQTLYFGEKRALRDNRIQLHRSTPTELSITISDVQLSDEGEYTCSIFTMPVRTARATVTVMGVPGKPQLSGYEEPVLEGERITLTCTSSGSKPPAKLRWYRGHEEIQGQPQDVAPDPDDRTFQVRSELHLTVTRADNEAPIACTVDHPALAEGDKRTERQLIVQYSPDVNIRPVSDLPREGEKFLLQCVGMGNPEPTSYEWKKKDGELPPLAKVDGSFLRFELLNKSDNGMYLCQADNGIGRGQGEYVLLVQAFRTSDVLSPATPPESPPSYTTPLTSYRTAPSSSLNPTPLFSSPSPSPAFLSSSSSLPFSSPSSESSFSSSTPLMPSQSVHSFPPSAPPALSTASFPSSSDRPPPFSLSSFTTSSVSTRLNGFYSFTDAADGGADPTAMSASSGVDHAVIGGVVAVIFFILLCLLIVLGRYLIRHKGTYLTHEAKGSDEAHDADTAIINAEGGHSSAEERKEYFI